MPQLPDKTALGAFEHRPATPAINVPVNPTGEAVQKLGASIANVGGTLAAAEQQSNDFEVQRRLIEFQDQQSEALEARGREAQPGAPGFGEQARQEFRRAGDAFYQTIPEALRPKYGVRLQTMEASVAARARTFETREQGRAANELTDVALDRLSARIAGATDGAGILGTHEEVAREGEELIRTAPLTPIERAKKQRDFRENAFKGVIDRFRDRIENAPTQEAADALKLQMRDAAKAFDTERARTVPAGGAGAVAATAERLGIDPRHLAAVISYETGGTFNPGKWGGKNNNHLGLIQFGANERATYGVRPGMSFEEQMGAVEAYLRDRGVKAGMGVAEIYTIVNAGSLNNGQVRWNASDGNGTIRDHVARIERDHLARGDQFLGGASAAAARGTAGQAPQAEFGPMSALAQNELEKADVKRRTIVARIAADQSELHERLLIDAQSGLGEIPSRASIETDPKLNDSQRNKLLLQHANVSRDVIKSKLALERFLDPNGGAFNPYDPEDKKAMDGVFRRLGGDASALQAVATRAGMVPPEAARHLRGALMSNEPARVAASATVAANLMARNPQIFTGVDGEQNIEKAAVRFNHYIDRFGYTPAQAANKLIELNSPEYKAKISAHLRTEDIDKQLREQTTKGTLQADLSSAFNENKLLGINLWGTRPTIESNPRARDGALHDYAEIIRERYLEHGDLTLAKTEAANQLRKLWGVSGINGTTGGTFMRFPPDRAPAFQGIPDVSIKIAQQVIAAIKEETGHDVPRNRISFAPLGNGQTARPYLSGEVPPYQVSWTDAKGTVHVAGRPFLLDAAAMRGAITEERRAGLEAMRTVDERTAAAVEQRQAPRRRLREEAGERIRADRAVAEGAEQALVEE